MKPYKFIAPTARKISTITICLCFVLVIMNTIAVIAFAPDRLADNKMKDLVKDYYENYYYDKMSEVGIDFSEYKNDGFPVIYLRQLLLFDNKRHENDRKYFDSENYKCDTNKSYVKIKPTEPYKKSDYTYDYELICNE